MGELDVPDPPAANRAESLDYKPDPAGAGRVSVRGFRLLLALTLLNTTLLGASTMGPQLFPFLRQQWAQWRADQAAKTAREQARQAALALRQQALAYSVPAGTVIYDEDPSEASRLIRDGGTAYARATPLFSNAPRGWVPPVKALAPKLYADFRATVSVGASSGRNDPLLFLHGRTSPDGTRHVVAVQLHPKFEFQSRTEQDYEARELRVRHTQAKERTLSVRAWPVGSAAAPEPVGPPPAKYTDRTYRLRLPDTADRVVASWLAGPGSDRRLPQVDYGNVLRFSAGEPDPNDPSHFTLPYRVDGRDGVIDGWVKDSGVELRPRDGEWTFDGGEVLRLNTPPTTRPTVYPPAPAGTDTGER